MKKLIMMMTLMMCFVGMSYGQCVSNAGTDDTLNCSTSSVVLDGSGSSSGMNYLWTTTTGNIVAGNTTIFALVNAPGVYTLTVTNTTNGCVNSDDVLVSIDTIKPIANAGLDMIRNCYNPTIILDGTSSSLGSNITYLWSGSSITNGNTATTTISGTGNYILTVTNTTNGCTSTDVSVVTSNFTQPGANAGGLDTICSGNSLVLNGTTTTGDVYVWTTSTGNIVSGGSTLTPTINTGGTYTLTTTNTTSGCTNSSNVFIHETFVSAIIVADPISGQVPLTVNFMINGIADSSYWNFANGQIFGDTSNLSIPSPVIYETQGTYVVSLTSTNGQCSATTQITINCVDSTISINEYKFDNYNIYLKNNKIVIKLNDNEKHDIIIYNIFGHTILNSIFFDNVEYDFNVKNGLYIIMIDETIPYKIIK